MINSPKILLLGTGYVLTEVAKKLDPADFIVTSRSALKLEQFRKSGFISREFDRAVPQTLTSILTEFPSLEVLVDSVPPSQNSTEMKIFSEEVFRFKFKKIIYLSTTGVYGVTDGSWVYETSPVNPLYDSSKLRVNAENSYFSFSNNLTCLRIPAIYGTGRSGIKESVVAGTFKIIESADKWTNRVHVDLLSSIIIKVIKDEINETILNCTDLNYNGGNPTLLSEELTKICFDSNVPYPETITKEVAIQRKMYSRLLNQRVGTIYL